MQRPWSTVIASFFLLIVASHSSSVDVTSQPKLVQDECLALSLRCEDDVANAIKGKLQRPELQSLRECLVQKASDYAEVLTKYRQQFSPAISTQDMCSVRLPVYDAVLDHCIPYWGSIYDDSGSFKTAQRLFAHDYGHFLNSFTCLNEIDLYRLHTRLELLQQRYYHYWVNLDLHNKAEKFIEDPTTNESPFHDLLQSVDAMLREQAQALSQELHSKRHTLSAEAQAEMEQRIASVLQYQRPPLPREEEKKLARYQLLTPKLRPFDPKLTAPKPKQWTVKDMLKTYEVGSLFEDEGHDEL